MSGRPVLATERLRLRELTDGDTAFLLDLLNQRGFIENIGDRGVRDMAGAAAYLRERVQGSYAAHGFGMWLVEPASGGGPAGLAGLVRREGLDMPDLGYAIAETAYGQGYATEAGTGVLRWARAVAGLRRLAAITTLTNTGSIRVLEKLGFRHVDDRRLPGQADLSRYFEIDLA